MSLSYYISTYNRVSYKPMAHICTCRDVGGNSVGNGAICWTAYPSRWSSLSDKVRRTCICNLHNADSTFFDFACIRIL